MNADQIYDNLSERAKRFVSREAIAEVLAAMQELRRLSGAATQTIFAGENATQAPIYQVWVDYCFIDVLKDAYDSAPSKTRRIVYAAPVAPQAAGDAAQEPSELHSAINEVADFLETSANLSIISQFTAITEWVDARKASTDADFFAGICVGLQVITAQDRGVAWREIVRACDVDKLLHYAAHIEPDEWELAGFAKYAHDELGKEKPAMLAAAPVAPAAAAPFQSRVQPWMLECFGAEIAADRIERNYRFFEEAAELVQACGMTASEAHQLVDYTFGRPVGAAAQEVGGVMVTLAALCLANGLDMHAAGETELARISVPETVAKIRAKQAAKPKHSPLPVVAAQPDERAAFEAWKRSIPPVHLEEIALMWLAWQARATAPQATAKGDERATCSDERPCIPCFTANGPCENAKAIEAVRADEAEHARYRHWANWFVNYTGQPMEAVDAWQVRATLDRAAVPQATVKGDEPAATLIAIGRLLSEAGYAPELRVIDAVREVISRAAAPQSTVEGDEAAGFDLSLASIDAYDPQSFINGAKWAFARATASQSLKGNEFAGAYAAKRASEIVGKKENALRELLSDLRAQLAANRE